MCLQNHFYSYIGHINIVSKYLDKLVDRNQEWIDDGMDNLKSGDYLALCNLHKKIKDSINPSNTGRFAVHETQQLRDINRDIMSRHTIKTYKKMIDWIPPKLVIMLEYLNDIILVCEQTPKQVNGENHDSYIDYIKNNIEFVEPGSDWGV